MVPHRITNIKVGNGEVSLTVECNKCSHRKIIYTTMKWWLRFVTEQGELSIFNEKD